MQWGRQRVKVKDAERLKDSYCSLEEVLYERKERKRNQNESSSNRESGQ